MLNKKTLKTPLYGTKFTIVLYDSPDELKDEFNDIDFSHEIHEIDGSVFVKNNELFIMFWIDEKSNISSGVIAHEAKHLVNKIFIDICCELDRYNDEPECYLLGWVVDEIHAFKNEILTK